MEKKVLLTEEITILKNLRDKRSNITDQFGIIESRIQELELQKSLCKEELQKLISEERTIGNNLQQKYGNGTIDLDKGEFIAN